MSSLNGKASIKNTEAQSTGEVIPATSEFNNELADDANESSSGETAEPIKKPKKKKQPTDKVKQPKVSRFKIDAGNGRIKFSANGYFGVVQSIISEVHSPQSTLGAFEWDGRSWLIGSDAESLNAKQRIEVASTPGAKITYFPHMVLGAIASHPSFLDRATRIDGDRYRKRLTIDLDCLALASEKDLFVNLKKVTSFSKDAITYEIDWRFLIAHPEGYGGAIAAHKLIKELDPQAKQFWILDCGNGTITLCPYNAVGKVPLAGIPRSGSGGGVMAILEKFSEQANTGDHQTIYFDQLRKSLERSKVIEENGHKRYQAIVSGSRKDLGDSLRTALHDWKDRHPSTKKIFREVDDALLDQNYVFCVGGGFEIPPIVDFVTSQFNSDRLCILPNPGTISLEGLENNANTTTKTKKN